MIKVRVIEDIYGDADLGTYRVGQVHEVTPEFAERFASKIRVIRDLDDTREVVVEGQTVRTAARKTPGTKR